MQTLEKGHIFEGKYRIRGELGRGGFGMVYQAYQVGMDRHVAIKMLLPEMADQAARTARERFLREIRIISKLRHPNTITIHDFGETSDGKIFMVLEFVDGETLKDLIKRHGAVPEERSGHIALQIAKSLSEAHRHGIVHRDLKPANIMLTELGGEKDFVKVLDFGVASLRKGRSNHSPDLTSVGLPAGERELIGTPRYMSPEQVRGEELDGASDVYSLGLMFYEVLTGEPAVKGDTAMVLITQQISPEPLRLERLSSVHPHLQHIVRTATHKQVQHRYRTIDLMAQEIEHALFELKRNSHAGFTSGAHESLSSNDFILGSGYDQYNAQPMSNPNHWGANPTPSGQFVTGAQIPAHHSYPPGALPHGNPGMSGLHHAPRHTPTGGMPGVGHEQMQGGWGQQQQPALEEAPTRPHLSALSADHLNAFETRNELEFNPGELPPPPDDDADNPFAVAPREPHTTGRNSAVRVTPPKEDSFTLALITTGIVAVLLVVNLYLVFIVLGAASELIIDGPLRLILTVIAALVIPTVPLVAEGGRRERFEIQYRSMYRARRAMAVGFSSSMVSFFLLCFALPEQIVSELRSNPNWFLGARNPANENFLERSNRASSYQIADLIEKSTLAVGMYDSFSSDQKVKPDTPEPTRPSATDPKNPTTKSPRKRRNLPAPTRPRQERDATKLLKKEPKETGKTGSKPGKAKKKKKRGEKKDAIYDDTW